MDVRFELQQQIFEWNQDKASANRRKHQVSFEKACEVFFDPFVRLVDASDQGESREAVIGLTEDWEPLFVVHVIRQGGSIRIISARPATPSERRTYEHE
ncbi:MAG: BrnT family toxin [Holophaga sp.]|nr:BrnT family toxin [Holophaga sp.]